jgi:hypothetical protein
VLLNPQIQKLPNKIQLCYTDGKTTDKSGATLALGGYCVPKSKWCKPSSKTLSKEQAQPIFNQQQKTAGGAVIGNMNNYQGRSGINCKTGITNINLGQFPLYNDVFCYTTDTQDKWAYCDNTESPPSPSGFNGKDIVIGVVVFLVIVVLIYIFLTDIEKSLKSFININAI